MGIQIHITRDDMVAAGWTPILETVKEEYEDGYTNGEPMEYSYMNFTKGSVLLHSHSDKGFCADCNVWGGNRELFRSLGLLDLPHILA